MVVYSLWYGLVCTCSTALHSTTTESNSTTSEPPTKKIKKEGPVKNDNIAGLYSVQFMRSVCIMYQSVT